MRVGVGPSCVTSLRTAAVGDGDDRDVGRAAVRRIAIDAMIERDLTAVGRPVEPADGERAARQPAGRPSVSTSTTKRCDMRWSWSMTSNSAYFFSRSLIASALRLVRRERDRPAVGRPARSRRRDSSADVSFIASPPREIDQVDLPLVVAVRAEGQPLAVRRPGGRVLDLRPLVSCRVAPDCASASQISVS